MKHFVIAIDWYGPFPLKKAVSEAKEHLNGGLYLCIGRQKWGRSRLPQYIGISSHSVGTRLETTGRISLISGGRNIRPGLSGLVGS
jgi:hypothetical protein